MPTKVSKYVFFLRQKNQKMNKPIPGFGCESFAILTCLYVSSKPCFAGPIHYRVSFSILFQVYHLSFNGFSPFQEKLKIYCGENNPCQSFLKGVIRGAYGRHTDIRKTYGHMEDIRKTYRRRTEGMLNTEGIPKTYPIPNTPGI